MAPKKHIPNQPFWNTVSSIQPCQVIVTSKKFLTPLLLFFLTDENSFCKFSIKAQVIGRNKDLLSSAQKLKLPVETKIY